VTPKRGAPTHFEFAAAPHLPGPEPNSDDEPSWTLPDDDDPSDEGEDLVQERIDEGIDDDRLRKEEDIGLGAIEDSAEVQEISVEGLPDIARLQYEPQKDLMGGKSIYLQDSAQASVWLRPNDVRIPVAKGDFLRIVAMFIMMTGCR